MEDFRFAGVVDMLVLCVAKVQKLAELSTTANLHLIDGILLTKFDTIDDKVGAALSMVYVSGVPVMFVGCGQTYTDLKKLNVKSLVKSLLV
jgi:signal recognition particle receptor subunit alpha